MRGAPAALLVLATACGSGPADQPPSAVDAGVGDTSPGGDDGALLPAPEVPRLEYWPCPAGWEQEPVTAEDEVLVRACAPPGPVVCEGATAQLPGDEGCRAIGIWDRALG